MARDICSYRRHHLKPATIRALIILMCTDRFLLLENLEAVEATEAAEEKNLPEEPEDVEILEIQEIHGLISDSEESDDEDSDHGYSGERTPACGHDDREKGPTNDHGFGVRRMVSKDGCLPKADSTGLGHKRPQGLNGRAVIDKVSRKRTGQGAVRANGRL